jgi:hypothetical protein
MKYSSFKYNAFLSVFCLTFVVSFRVFRARSQINSGFSGGGGGPNDAPPTVAFIKIQITAEDVIEFIGLIKPGRDDMRKLARSIGPGVGPRKSRIVPPKI